MANSKPKNQSDILESGITSYLEDRPVNISSKLNRGTRTSVKDDIVRDFSVGFQDIDSAIIYYFTNVIRPQVFQNGKQVQVPIIYGNQERWASVQKDGFYRDKNGKIQSPIIMYKRDSIERNRSLGNKLDANNPRNFAVFEKKYNKQNAYDRYGIFSNNEPRREFYGVIIPDYVNIVYSCVIFTDYIEQMNKIVESINFASDSYWGDPEKFKFRAMIDSFSTTTDLAQGEDRKIRTEFQIRLLGHIIADSINAQINGMNKFYSKTNVKFGIEVAGTAEELRARVDRVSKQSKTPVTIFDGPAKVININDITNITVGSAIVEYIQTEPQITWTFTHNLNFRYPIITVYDADNRLVLPVTTEAIDDNTLVMTFPYAFTGRVTAAGKAEDSAISVLSKIEREYLVLNTVLDSGVDSNEIDPSGYGITFQNVRIATPPVGYPPISFSDFLIFINGISVEISAINSIIQSGNDIIISFNQTLDFQIDPLKEIVVVGKINKLQ